MNKAFIVLILITLAAAQNSIFEKHLNEKNFLNFSKKHQKRYKSLEESLYRFSIYKDNLKKIEQQNKENPNATFGENTFTDLTQEEFEGLYCGAKIPIEDMNSNRNLQAEYHHERNLATYPASLDLRTTQTIQPVRNQGGCGSCWAFSTIATIEYASYKKTGYSGDLAEQQLVDCVYPNGGCGGGWMPTAMNYIAQNGGINWETNYKYTAKNGVCQASSLLSKVSVFLNKTKSYAQVAKDDASVKSAVANIGILSVCVDASGWSGYRSGIYVDTRLSDQTKNPSCTHAVAIIGYGTQNNIPYYLIRNSWGASWGEQGHIRMDARRYANGNLYSGLMLSYTYYPLLQ